MTLLLPPHMLVAVTMPQTHPLAPRRYPRKPRAEPLFESLARMDKRASPEKPLVPCLWVAVVASPILRQQAEDMGLLPPADAEPWEEADEEFADYSDGTFLSRRNLALKRCTFLCN